VISFEDRMPEVIFLGEIISSPESRVAAKVSPGRPVRNGNVDACEFVLDGEKRA
jgi:hypothetical protein